MYPIVLFINFSQRFMHNDSYGLTSLNDLCWLQDNVQKNEQNSYFAKKDEQGLSHFLIKIHTFQRLLQSKHAISPY